jgi:hypothetical protein
MELYESAYAVIDRCRRRSSDRHLFTAALVMAVLLGAAVFGYMRYALWLLLFGASMGVLVLSRWLALGPLAIVSAALIVRFDISTGTEVSLNPVTLLVPALLVLWVLTMMRQREWQVASSPTNRPLLLFLGVGLLSILIGNLIWDPAVPRSGNFVIVQLAQWSVFAFSAIAFLLGSNLMRDRIWLHRLVFYFLAVAGILAILATLPQTRDFAARTFSSALWMAPFWMLLTALAGGQLLFNRELSAFWRLYLVGVIAAILVFVLGIQRETVSYWVGVVTALGGLVWLRWPRMRWVFVCIALLGVVLWFPLVYQAAGGDAEWQLSGGSRLALSGRVIKVTLRNPITGLGPAAYRSYARMEPLRYGRALWMNPTINSHNNYVDLFSQVGVVGLGLFFWFIMELVRLGFRVRSQVTDGFTKGYVNAILSAWAGSLVLMLLADWILPFVYNVGFHGFQASVLIWAFSGGIVALDNLRIHVAREDNDGT